MNIGQSSKIIQDSSKLKDVASLFSKLVMEAQIAEQASREFSEEIKAYKNRFHPIVYWLFTIELLK